MKKSIFILSLIGLVAISCSGPKGMYKKATSSSCELSQGVYSLPSIASLQVQSNHVNYTMKAEELASLNNEEREQTLIANALKGSNADVLVAPYISVVKDAEGKMVSMSVVGYPATIKGLRSATVNDSYLIAPSTKTFSAPQSEVVHNMTISDVEYLGKVTISLKESDLLNVNEKQAKQIAQERLLIQNKADLFFAPQYAMTYQDGKLSSFVMTAFPARYTNYRTATKDEIVKLQPKSKPIVVYQTMTTDIKPVADRIQITYDKLTTTKENEIKAFARESVLKKYNADLILNEQMYFNYSNNVITSVVVCGTPAIYTNFRPMTENDVIDDAIILKAEAAEEEAGPTSILDTFKNLFKKK
ncbi:MAG: hypothetical protein MJZ84_05415 [Paludibacteraceae bacterium]|nr:hypothetical protein [Paludibacteraceae bacterium]